MLNQKEANELIDRLSALEAPVLSVYADINPASPDNKGGAWRKRIKNALKDIPEIQKRPEHALSLNDAILELINEERPAARTMALFAKQNHLGKLFVERVDLNVDLPVVDLRAGRSQARFGAPWIAPLIFAMDEYERTAVLHLNGSKWRFFELFLGDLKECDNVFAGFDEQDWKDLKEAAEFIRSGELRAKTEPDKSGSTKDTYAAKLGYWRHKLYVRLGRLLERALHARGINRLVLMGEEPETAVCLNALPRQLRAKVVARVHNPKDLDNPTVADIKKHVEPVLEDAERKAEMALLDEIQEQPGIWGLGKVLDALQIGQLDTLVVPFDSDAKIWACPDYGLVSADRETLAELCDGAEQVALGDRIFSLAGDYGTRLEFVEGPAKKRLNNEFGGIAAKRRW